MKAAGATLALLLGGCNLVFGLEPPVSGMVAVDGDPGDGEDGDGMPADAAMCGSHDEDSDGVPDGCDNCPHLANSDQAHSRDSDSVGDACDPHPLQPIDHLVRFDSFATLPPDMVTVSSIGPSAFQIGSDALIDGDAQLAIDELARFPVGPGPITVITTYTIINLIEPQKGQSAAVGIWGVLDGSSGVFPGGVLAEAGVEVGIQRVVVTELADTSSMFGTRGLSPRDFGAGARITMTLTIGDTVFAEVTVVDTSNGEMDQATLATGEVRGVDVGLRTRAVGASFDYLVVYGHADP